VSDRREIATSPTGESPVDGCGPTPRLTCDPPEVRPTSEAWSQCDELSRPHHFRLQPDQINRKLSLHPGLAAAFGKRCARDCDDVHAFEATYRAYAKEHPGFDANEPSPPLWIPPPHESGLER
jgi:hypothetical protein